LTIHTVVDVQVIAHATLQMHTTVIMLTGHATAQVIGQVLIVPRMLMNAPPILMTVRLKQQPVQTRTMALIVCVKSGIVEQEGIAQASSRILSEK